MKDLGRVVVMIPARAGSKRVKAKNLRDLCGQPLLAYAIHKSKSVFEHQNIYVNSDSLEILQLAKDFEVNGYLRRPELASDAATGDEFAIDFMRNIAADTCVMISPVCPLLKLEDIRRAIADFRNSDCDTLISCENTQMQTFCNNKEVNIDTSGYLLPTQENPVVSILNWAVTIWDVASFISNFEERGSAYIGKNRILFPIEPLHALKISNEHDFQMAEILLSAHRKYLDC